jgi:hypothetical protein
MDESRELPLNTITVLSHSKFPEDSRYRQLLPEYIDAAISSNWPLPRNYG